MAAASVEHKVSILEIGDDKRQFEIENGLFEYPEMFEEDGPIPVLYDATIEEMDNIIEMGRRLKETSNLIELFRKKERYLRGKQYWQMLEKIDEELIKIVFYNYKNKKEHEIYNSLIPNKENFKIVKKFVNDYMTPGGKSFYIRALSIMRKYGDLDIIKECCSKLKEDGLYAETYLGLLDASTDEIVLWGINRLDELADRRKYEIITNRVIYLINQKKYDKVRLICGSKLIGSPIFVERLKSKIYWPKEMFRAGRNLKNYLTSSIININVKLMRYFESIFDITREQKFIHFAFNGFIEKAEELFLEEYKTTLALESLFDVACHNGKLDCVKYLMTKVNYSRKIRDLYLSAASTTNVETIEWLLENGGLLSECMDADFFNALRSGNINVVKYIYSEYKKYSLHIPGEGPDGACVTLEESFVELCEKSSFSRNIHFKLTPEIIIECLEFIMSIKEIDSSIIIKGFMNFNEEELLEWFIPHITNDILIEYLTKSDKFSEKFLIVLEKTDLSEISEETIKEIWENVNFYCYDYKVELFEEKIRRQLESESEIITEIKKDLDELKKIKRM